MKIGYIAGAFLAMAAVVFASGPEPNYWPTCQDPQNIAPSQWTGGAGQGYRSAMAWSGTEYALAWSDESLYFRRFFSDGSPASALIPIGSSCDSPPALVWNGTGYAVALQHFSGTTFKYEIQFLLLDAKGTIVHGPVTVSTSTADCYFPALAWSGSAYGVVWADARNGFSDIYSTLLDSDGNITSGDIVVSNASLHQTRPVIAWSRSGGKFQVVWEDSRNAGWDLYGCQLSPVGGISNIQQFVPGAPEMRRPSLSDTGNGLGLVWNNGTNSSVFFCRISANGYKVGSDVTIISGQSYAANPRIVWTGAEYGVIWENQSAGDINIWFQRISALGGLQGASRPLTETPDTEMPDLAFGRFGYLISGGSAYLPFSVWSIGCAADSTPPSCPGNLLAFGITGTTASFSWLPSSEDYTDIAYYQVYRNNIPLAKTSDNYYNDSGLTPGGTYNYSVRPVNAVQLENGTCNSSVYVKANASLILKMDKSTPDAHLFWTDGGMNNYNVFRGTSPQVMTLIDNTSGQETQDPNVLLDGVTYFYTVDDPVQ